MQTIQIHPQRPARAALRSRLILAAAAAVVIIGILNIDKFRQKPVPVQHSPRAARRGEVLMPVARRMIAPYSEITADSIVKLPVPKSSLVGKDFILDEKDIKWRIAQVEIKPNTPFTEAMLADKGKNRAGPIGQIPPGYVAHALDANQIEGHLDGMQEGDYVALLTHAENPVWVSKQALVLKPYKNETRTERGRDGMPIIEPKPKNKQVNTGKLAIALSPQDEVLLAKALAAKTKLIVLALNPWDEMPIEISESDLARSPQFIDMHIISGANERIKKNVARFIDPATPDVDIRRDPQPVMPILPETPRPNGC